MYGFTLSEAWELIQPLGIFVFGVAIYSIFVFKFYRLVSKKDLFELDLQQYNHAKHNVLIKIFEIALYTIKYVLIFPVMLFFWFIVFTVLLSFLSTGTIRTVLLTSMAIIGAIRVTAYYDEELSKDVAKMLPFALLGILLVDVTFFNFDSSIELIKQMTTMFKTMSYYLIFVIALEFVLRILSFMFKKKPKNISSISSEQNKDL